MKTDTTDGRSIRSRILATELTQAEDRIAQVVLNDYPQSALLNGRRIAVSAGVSPASVTRFATKIGYASFSELQDALRVEMRERLSTPARRLAIDQGSRKRAAAALVARVVERDIENLRTTLELLNPADLERLTDRLATNRGDAYVAGSKKAHIVARYFALQLAQLRGGVRLLDLNDNLADQLLDVQHQDLLLVFEPRRATRPLVKLVEMFRRRHADVAFFGDENPPPTLAQSEFVFSARIAAITAFDSYAGLFALCDGILAALIQRKPRFVADRASALEALNRSFGVWHETSRQAATRADE